MSNTALSQRANATDTHSGTTTDVAFLQRRVALAGLLGGCVSLGFLLLRTSLILFAAARDSLWEPSMLAHAAATLALFSAWFLNRGALRSVRFVRTVESAAFLSACLSLELMGYYTPLPSRPELIVALALTFSLVARAVYVPSTARRTLILTGAAGVPLLIVTFVTYFSYDFRPWAAIDPGVAALSKLEVAVLMTVFEAGWWTAATAICTFASRVIYGLRREVRSVRRLGQYVIEEQIGAHSRRRLLLRHGAHRRGDAGRRGRAQRSRAGGKGGADPARRRERLGGSPRRRRRAS
jgi:hypothetical protein